MKKMIIIATYNEKDNIEKMLAEVYENVPDVHVLVIDDNSPDKTYEIVENLAATKYSGKLFLIKRAGKLGLGTAYVAGFNWGLARDYDAIGQMDADFSHNPKYLPSMFEALKTYDLVLGSRYVAGGGVVNWSLKRKLISRGGSLYAKIILGLPQNDLTGGFKCFRREVLETIDVNQLKSTGYSFQIETTYKTYLNGFKIKEIPIIFEDRVLGVSKMSGNIFKEAILMVLALRKNRDSFIKPRK
ncbi:MAG: polyprenol monophosphomannose synthase [Burkholderiales bacterium]|nr:polyprenol monophosphomannose synthase [Burkholderiales bacterium]MBP9769263.1 polyprenol monophosphomannose synthase [Burkholderiales bacterium]MBX9866532.1 polyprenol monophosphomannose synthase [Burkholderiales bacterium]